MTKRLTAAAAVILAASSVAYATGGSTVVDSTGKLVGYTHPGFHQTVRVKVTTGWVAIELLSDGTRRGPTTLFYYSTDCSGTAYVRADPGIPVTGFFTSSTGWQIIYPIMPFSTFQPNSYKTSDGGSCQPGGAENINQVYSGQGITYTLPVFTPPFKAL